MHTVNIKSIYIKNIQTPRYTYRIGENGGVVLRGHVALHALSVASAALVNVPASGIAAHERNRTNLRRVADEIHSVLNISQ